MRTVSQYFEAVYIPECECSVSVQVVDGAHELVAGGKDEPRGVRVGIGNGSALLLFSRFFVAQDLACRYT